MFSLIITIISIALVTALALATIYYGGSAFRQGSEAAAAARYINEGQQLSGAAAVVQATSPTVGLAIASQAQLKTANALSSQVANYAENVVGGNAFVSLTATVSDAVCTKVNEKATGTVGAPKFADIAAVVNYGCFGTAADANTVAFKF